MFVLKVWNVLFVMMFVIGLLFYLLGWYPITKIERLFR